MVLGENGIDNYMLWRASYPVTPQPGYGDLKAYFNMDNGSGKVRGVYAEGNSAAALLLKEWLSPFDSMGAGSVVAGPTGGTDHESFQSVAVPGYEFIQDPLDYESRVHHSTIDAPDHLSAPTTCARPCGRQAGVPCSSRQRQGAAAAANPKAAAAHRPVQI